MGKKKRGGHWKSYVGSNSLEWGKREEVGKGVGRSFKGQKGQPGHKEKRKQPRKTGLEGGVGS